MTVSLNIWRERILSEGSYRTRLVSLEEKETAYGERLLWLFQEAESSVEVAGFSTRSESTRAKAYRWAQALNPEIASKRRWSSTDVVGRECLLEVEVVKGQKGEDKNRILSIKPAPD